jgi:DivIVA domain-containing protein
MDSFSPGPGPKTGPQANPASDLQAIRMHSDAIRNKGFAVARRGYAPAQVRQYLGAVATWIDELKTRVIDLEAELRTFRERGDAPGEAQSDDRYANLGSSVADILRSVDLQARKLRREVEEEASRQAAEAHREAEQIQRDAQAEADRILREAEEARETAEVEVKRALRAGEAETERMRLEAERAFREAEAEASLVLGSLLDRRNALLEDLRELAARMGDLTGQLKADIGNLEGGEERTEGTLGGDEPAEEVIDVNPESGEEPTEGTSGGDEPAEEVIDVSRDGVPLKSIWGERAS